MQNDRYDYEHIYYSNQQGFDGAYPSYLVGRTYCPYCKRSESKPESHSDAENYPYYLRDFYDAYYKQASQYGRREPERQEECERIEHPFCPYCKRGGSEEPEKPYCPYCKRGCTDAPEKPFCPCKPDRHEECERPEKPFCPYCKRCCDAPEKPFCPCKPDKHEECERPDKPFCPYCKRWPVAPEKPFCPCKPNKPDDCNRPDKPFCLCCKRGPNDSISCSACVAGAGNMTAWIGYNSDKAF